jgi:hypothetical protein
MMILAGLVFDAVVCAIVFTGGVVVLTLIATLF